MRWRERYECETEKHEMERVRYETEVLHSGRGSTIKNFARRIVFHMINPQNFNAIQLPRQDQ